MDILKETAARHAVTLVPVEPEITSQQAAELLNVSRPCVVGLIDKGTLPARMVGNHRRLPLPYVQSRPPRQVAPDATGAVDVRSGTWP
jgi:excisionase family DNA binding protein